MNDSNILYYLTQEMEKIKNVIEVRKASIRASEQNIDDDLKDIQKLKVHYTSLLNTALAYGYEPEEEDEE